MDEKKRILGVIGGLGPLSTAHFMELVVKMTDAETEQDNVDMIVYNFPSIPDRSGYILGYYMKNPYHGLLHVGNALVAQNVDLIAIPCMTAHYFYGELSSRIEVPIIDAIKETALQLKQLGITTVGIMATEGTISSGLFTRELDKQGIAAVLPSPTHQKDVTHLIYQNIKAGLEPEMERFRRVEAQLRADGAEAIILGCTELSLIKRDHTLGPGFLDAMEVLAQQSVLRCGKQLKDEYRALLTK